jgi:hypothetical protein
MGLSNSAIAAAILRIRDSMGKFTFELTQATGGSFENPFKDSTSASGTSTPLHSRSLPILSSVGKRTAHCIIMSIAFVILLPSFALTLYIIPSSKTVPHIHAPLQILSLALVIAGFGLGVSLARDLEVTVAYHPIIGYIVIGCLILFQPAMGLLQHLHFRKTSEKSLFAYGHRWLGRVLLVSGIINGGLGFRFAQMEGSGAPRGAVIAYSVVAGVMGSMYIATVIIGSVKQRGR